MRQIFLAALVALLTAPLALDLWTEALMRFLANPFGGY